VEYSAVEYSQGMVVYIILINVHFTVSYVCQKPLIDTLFRSAPFLRQLTMEVWTPSGRGLQLFAMHSETLEMLDVSACRGFYLEFVELPCLRIFKVSVTVKGAFVPGV